MSSISLFVGIPTQEHRTVQGNLTRLIGNVLRLAHKCREDTQGQGKKEYDSLIEGATAYSSVFGHWVSKKDYSSRSDDHSEVIELFMSPNDYHPILLLTLCEIAYPVLLLANQDAILVLTSHEGVAHRVILWRKKAADAVPRPKQEDKNVNDDPIQFLKYLLFALIQAEMGRQFLISKSSSLNWLSLDPEKSNPLYKGLPSGWERWLKAHGDIDDNKVVKYPGLDDSADATPEYLPTIYIRLLLNAACWWLFYGASQTIKEHGGLYGDDLWRWDTVEIIIELLEKELNRLDSVYLTPRQGVDMGRQELSLASDDPLPNAILWLTFVRDFIAHSRNSSTPPTKTKIAYEKTDPLNMSDNGESQTLTSSDTLVTTTFRLRFDEFAGKILPKKQVTLLSAGDASSLGYWKKRLELLEKLNDRYFPDDHLLKAWEILFHLIEQPKIAVDTGQDTSCDLGFSVKWASWLSKETKKVAEGPDRWVRLGRVLRDAPAIARLWVAPLMTEAIYKFATVGISPKDKSKLDFNTTNLRALLENQYPSNKQGLSTIEKIAKDAVAGFPLELATIPKDQGSFSDFIASMQAQQ